MSLEQIQSAIPHRAPMLLVDEIVREEDEKIVCRKTFRSDEFFLQGHYPNRPIVPGVMLCEAAMQAGAILLSKLVNDSNGHVPVVTRMYNVKFRKMVLPGDSVDLEVGITRKMSDAFFLSAKILVDGKIAARFEFGCAMANVPQLG